MKILHRSLLLSFALVPAVALRVQGQAPATNAPPARLGSIVFQWDSLAVKPTGVGQRRDVTDRPTATLQRFESHISTLNAGLASHPQHRHAQEEFIILKEGTLDVVINGKPQRVGPGSLFFFAANDYHSVQNVGSNAATYLVFNLQTAATRTAPSEGAAATAKPGILPSSVYDWDKLAARPTQTGARREVFNSPTVTCANLEAHITTLNVGEAPHAAHRHPDEELLVVKDGLVEVTINGVAQRAGPGSVVFFGSNDEHGLKNAGPAPATYYIFRVVTEATPKVAAK